MKTPTPMCDALAFTINRDVVVHVYPANEVVPAQFARGLEAGLAEAMRQIEELQQEKLQALDEKLKMLDACSDLVKGLKFRA